MQKQLEYIQLFMEFEFEDMQVVYFYEVDQDNERFALRAKWRSFQMTGLTE